MHLNLDLIHHYSLHIICTCPFRHYNKVTTILAILVSLIPIYQVISMIIIASLIFTAGLFTTRKKKVFRFHVYLRLSLPQSIECIAYNNKPLKIYNIISYIS